MADLATVIGLVSAATALVASIAGPLVALHVGRTQVRATVLSANRQRWIDSFRELIAEFCSQAAVAVQIRAKLVRDGKVQLSGEPEVLHQFERLVFTFAKIRLMSDPLDEHHRELVEVIERMLMTLRTAETSSEIQPETEAAARHIINIAHTIIRQEWQRVRRMA